MGQDEINLMSDAAHQEWLDLNAEVTRLHDEAAKYKFVHESDERALRAIAESADRYAVECVRLREALEALEPYASHRENCRIYFEASGCTCGLDATLSVKLGKKT